MDERGGAGREGGREGRSSASRPGKNRARDPSSSSLNQPLPFLARAVPARCPPARTVTSRMCTCSAGNEDATCMPVCVWTEHLEDAHSGRGTAAGGGAGSKRGFRQH